MSDKTLACCFIRPFLVLAEVLLRGSGIKSSRSMLISADDVVGTGAITLEDIDGIGSIAAHDVGAGFICLDEKEILILLC